MNKVAKWFKDRPSWTEQQLANITGTSQQYISILKRCGGPLSARFERIMKEVEKNQKDFEVGRT
jgi:hypothetical protein